MEAKQNSISNIVDIVYLTPENAEFTVSVNHFLQLKANVAPPETLQDLQEKEKKEKDGETDTSNEIQEFYFERVFLHRAFPFDNPYKYISVVGNFPKKEVKDDKKDDEKKEAATSKEKSEDKTDKSDGEKKEDSPAQPRENTTSLGDLKEIGIISDINVFDEKQQQYIINELDRKYFTPTLEIIYSLKDKFGFSYWEAKTNVGKIKFTVNDAYRNIIKVSDDRIMINDVNGNRYEIKSLQNFDKASYRKLEIYL